ncbi:phage integrase [Methylobacterium sp. 4-46]|uniref:integrase n=1 Tax=Methylobacterium sp. (strain 4-46) TaxID=426117 RepID=UPI000152C678|nr:integrase [Methylobacterium sp. 4-46]ACA18638.1 phage integrase [Methylobacterium sp. 4-46]
MPSKSRTPGLKKRGRPGGTVWIGWFAPHRAVEVGFRPPVVRFPYSPENPDHRPLIEAACQRLQAEMLAFLANRGRDKARFDGTILALSRRYQTDPASPFQRLKHNSRHKDTYTLKLIEAAVGKRALAALKIGDFYRWYDEAKKPKVPGGPERVRRAWGIIKKLRELFAYGVMAELPECERLYTILKHARFAQPARRRVVMQLAHVEAFIARALAMGRLSLALGTAIQFETAMRQKDVIGEWEPIPAGAAAREGGFMLNGRRWVRGLTWADLAADLVIRKATTKTGAFAAHDLKLCPLVLDLLERVPPERRSGPLIIDEVAGRPYAESAYGREWRVVARAAGLPSEIWNMDARAGAITEAEEAGADLDHIRSAAAHAQTATTQRYSRGAVGKSRRVAEMRLAYRAERGRA